MQLAHWASFQGVSLVEKLVKGSSEIVIDVVPAATFSFPEVSQVGITEQEAKEKGIKYVKSKFNFSGNGKAVSLGEAEGFVKIIAKEDLSEILGVHIVGPHANDLIHEGAIAIANKLSVSDIARLFMHIQLYLKHLWKLYTNSKVHQFTQLLQNNTNQF